MTTKRLFKSDKVSVFAFVILAIGIAVAGIVYYLQQKEQLRTAKLHELSAIAELKAREIASWRKRQTDQALTPLRNPFTARAIATWQSTSDRELENQLRSWMRKFREHHQLKDVIILDKKGTVLLSVPEKVTINPHVLQQVLSVPAREEPIFTDFHRTGPEGEIVISLFTPLFAPDPPRDHIGYFVLKIDPAAYLYPYIQLWPTPSPSAETILVERDVDKVIALNELRHRKNTALNFRAALREEELPAAQAVLRRNGTLEGRDYRGEPVLAAFREVPGSPWVLLAKIDRREVYAEMEHGASLIGATVAALIFSVGALLGLLAGRQRTRMTRERQMALEERDRVREELLAVERKGARELKESEEELRRLKEELELRVEERTAELAAANRELEAFAYTISHDLRAPLRHVTSFVELLAPEAGASLSDKGHRYIGIISDSARRMSALIDDLLEFSRLGRTPVAAGPVDLGEIVAAARRELEPETAGREIDWIIEELPQVRGDAILLRTVVVNLLSNAIKYTRGRTPARIEVGSREGAGEVICFVRDNGAGFDMRFADKLFGVFQRLHRAQEFEGVGIGLASVRRIIQRHGGRTWGEGEVGKGATFFFSLPLGE